uniref:Phenylalanine--tRNA ligase beta subunit n=1 Tax=Anthurium amnicola TaxID=1678845 RepID=A0A1D1ZL99_9ARAE
MSNHLQIKIGKTSSPTCTCRSDRTASWEAMESYITTIITLWPHMPLSSTPTKPTKSRTSSFKEESLHKKRGIPTRGMLRAIFLGSGCRAPLGNHPEMEKLAGPPSRDFLSNKASLFPGSSILTKKPLRRILIIL